MMSPRVAVFVLVASIAATVPACGAGPEADPVWGAWEAPSAGCNARTVFEIDPDYNGEGRIVFDDCSVCEIRLDVAEIDAGEYEIEVDGVTCDGTLDLDCTLQGELACEDRDGARYYFRRE